ncbi:ankyrin repeat domain-containing protein 10-like isoform X1 [Ptychodera flava]|uniref:ankyrin repeat domain-containing protein 10-like isoform X1 n=1 Tax=Ptychodera flava TaxID=63121 RepID=UPI00396A58C8
MESSYSFGYWGSESEAILRRSYPVHRACRDGDTQTLALLIANGQHSGMYVEDQFYGWTPAHWAAYFGKLDCLRNLVACGVNIDIATKRFNQTPLHIAAFGVHPHCLQWLIQSGADVNRQDYLGETAMHKAARSGTVECIGLLYCHGSQLNIANHNGHTLIQLAISCGNEHCAEYIKQLSVGHPAANGFHRNGFHQAADPPQQNGFHNNVSSNNNSLPHSMNRKRALVDDDEMSCFKKSRTDGACYNGLPVAAQNGLGAEPYTAVLGHKSPCEMTCTSAMERQVVVGVGSGHQNGLSLAGVVDGGSVFICQDNFSNSAIEHQRTVQLEQGYDSMMCDSLLSESGLGSHSILALK